jgi:uncharacterized protein
MTNVYFDASALVPLFFDDEFSDRAKRLMAQQVDVAHVSDWTIAESFSAIGRAVRMKLIGREDLDDLCSTLDTWVSSVAHRVAIEPSDIRQAESALRRFEFNLRTPDALHIVVASRLGLPLATFDRNMAETARGLGVEVIDG